MRKKIVAGNWKMNLNFQEANKLYKELSQVELPEDVTVIVAPPALYLSSFTDVLSDLSLACQNVSQYEKGAYTGEIAATMLGSIGLDYCIVGHSERRAHFGDTDNVIKSKVDLLLPEDIIPIVCCGETLEQREAGKAKEVVIEQLKAAIGHLSKTDMANVVIAYEPVWAIGTGVTATKEEAQEMHAQIRLFLTDLFGNIAQSISILYGGSCKPENAKALFACKDIDGGLIGGAALNVDSFEAIFNSFS
ncbi:MAG: triosephosphate isomerase [Flavobacteriales bacterium]|jgi:triosephosphate isomerase